MYVFSGAYYDSFLANNIDLGGVYDATWLLGDCKNDRIVEMMDFFAATRAYASSEEDANYDQKLARACVHTKRTRKREPLGAF